MLPLTIHLQGVPENHQYFWETMYDTETPCYFRLKLVPDERRSQQSSTLTGAGTIMVDQEFLFHVKQIISLSHK